METPQRSATSWMVILLFKGTYPPYITRIQVFRYSGIALQYREAQEQV